MEQVAPMPQLGGTYALAASHNTDACMLALGIGLLTRLVARSAQPTIAVSVVGDHWRFDQAMAARSTVREFDLGVPHRFRRAVDGKEVRSVVTRQGAVLTERAVQNGRTTEIIREFADDQLRITMRISDTECTQTFKRTA
ncbi:fatty acid-binding protein-like [Pollicipes pollicipes]|uniref:fatty acid-binding protein-like n=1 Tax=Pollicipes pollicipes TaxID=41117 RepID=UPI001885028E|nr:fatty acid-binding protein-like [Pollicipes pollicipes]